MIELEQYTTDVDAVRQQILTAGEALHVGHMKEQIDELTEEMNQPEFWNDLDRSTKVNQKLGHLKTRLAHYEKLLSTADDIEVMISLAQEENDESMVQEVGEELTKLKEQADALELETLMRGDYDDCDAILSLHAGAGGTEAQDWTQMLYRMYTRYCEKMGFTVKVLDLLEGDEAGIKSVTFEVSGDHAYGYLRGEKGVHRLVRISPFDANARRHTSFSSLDVAPILDDDNDDIEINMKDVRVDTLPFQRRWRTEREQDQLCRANDALPHGHCGSLPDGARSGTEPCDLLEDAESPLAGAARAREGAADGGHQGRDEEDRVGQSDSLLRLPALYYGQGSPHRLRGRRDRRCDGRRPRRLRNGIFEDAVSFRG